MIFKWLYNNWPHVDIKAGEVVHWRRFFLFTRSFPTVYLNHIIHGDRPMDLPHDHPTWFLTLVLKGGYTDEEWDVVPGCHATVSKLDVLTRWSVRYRPATHTHRVLNPLHNTWTINLWGKHQRGWGFWDKLGNLTPGRVYKDV